MARPVGVTILAILALIGGVLGLLGSFGLMALGGVVAVGGAAGMSSHAVGGGSVMMLVGGFMLLQSILSLAFGVGALMLKPWAWTLGVFAEALSLLVSLAQFATGRGMGGPIFSIIIALFILYYLFTPNVREAFGKA